jgi:hypothetical protein
MFMFMMGQFKMNLKSRKLFFVALDIKYTK